jgi:hypothetical protein
MFLLYAFRMTIALVSGALANKPGNGGNAWTRLQWVLGLEKLGIKTYFIEQIARGASVDGTGAADFQDSDNLAYFAQVTERFGLTGSCALIYNDGEQVFGMTQSELFEAAEAADLFVNISGHLTFEPLRRRLRRQIYFDDDPGYTQFWHATGNAGPRLFGHDYYFTVGHNIGTPDCPVPTAGITWRGLGPLVVLDQWPANTEGDRNRFTTVASWRGPYGPVEFAGQTYGLKVHEFRKFIELPRLVQRTFEIALSIHPADSKDRTELERNGWRVVGPKDVTSTPDRYRDYLQGSGAEFSAAQGIYVQANTGWFSDRTACYLASGKPALVQDTGFGRRYPVGEGLLVFRTLDEAVSGVDRIASDYDKHARAARALAEEYFDSNEVLRRLFEQIDLSP